MNADTSFVTIIILKLFYFTLTEPKKYLHSVIINRWKQFFETSSGHAVRAVGEWRQGVKNIGRWTHFCDPLKKNGMNSLEGIS